MSSSVPPSNLQTGPPIDERSTTTLRIWLVAFPVLGGVILGVVGRYAWQRAGELTPGQWFSIAFTVVLGLLVVSMPPTIAFRELRRRRLEREDPDDDGAL